MMKTSLKGVEITREKISENLVEEILFKSILYRLLNKVKTFLYFGEIPSIRSLPGFLDYLKVRKENHETIFTAAHQSMGINRGETWPGVRSAWQGPDTETQEMVLRGREEAGGGRGGGWE